MNEKNTTQEEASFNTDYKYAIVAGWLILPAIHVIVSTIGSLLIITMGNPADLNKVGLITYIFSVIFLPFLAFIIYSWFKRKRFLPILMMVFYTIQAIESLFVYVSGYTEEMFYSFISIILIVYFIRSKRVKATFTE